MAPTFAIDLSPDGIRLLYRAEGGWTVVGDVAIEDPALTERLAGLRAEAERIVPGAVTTELVIPPSQIRYATAPRPAAGTVTAATLLPVVEGLTPLAAEELVFDWEVDGDAVRLALVDRTTLNEAEAFAEAHGFNPVSFGARPTPAQFPRAPDFGTTARAVRAAEPAEAPPPPLPAAETTVGEEDPPKPEAVGAEALARSLSAPHPGDLRPEPAVPPRPARKAARLPWAPWDQRAALAAGGGLAAALALALYLGTGGFSDPAASIPDTPPDVVLALPALGQPDSTDATPASPSALGDAAPSTVTVATVVAPDLGEGPTADTSAPAALVDDAPAGIAAASGPTAPSVPATEATEDIYLASIDPVTRASDAVALLPADAFPASTRPAAPLPPPPAGTSFEFTADGLVVATPEGAFTPEGLLVTLGRPVLAPPAAPARAAEIQLEPTEVALALPDRRPRPRPTGLVERNERATLGGRSRSELAAVRPLARPASSQAEALAAAPAAPTRLAVAASPAPRDRPADLATRVATANAIAAALATPAPEERPAAPPAAAVAPAPAVAAAPADLPEDDDEPEVVAAAPNIPTTASVARQATIRNAILLREINLLGVYGTDRDRRALVRMPNGRLVRVKVGDRLDGGQIAAIGRDELRYIKGGRNVTLTVPSG